MTVKTNRYNALYYRDAPVKYYRSIMVMLLLLALGCSGSDKAGKDANVDIDVINNVGFKSVSAKNGIYVKLIPVEGNSCTLLVSIANYADTLDYYLTSETEQQSVPKVLFGTDYVVLLTGSSSYRYVTLSYLDRRFKRIITHKYTTSRDVSSDIDGAVFFKGGYYYLYDLEEHELRCMRSGFNIGPFNEAVLFDGDSILMKGERETKKCKKQDFSIEGNLLTPIVLR